MAQAVKCFGALAAAVAPADEHYGAVMSNLGNALGDRYLRTRSATTSNAASPAIKPQSLRSATRNARPR